jgi:hypothetical protein
MKHGSPGESCLVVRKHGDASSAEINSLKSKRLTAEQIYGNWNTGSIPESVWGYS